MPRDPQLLLTIQVALLGIVVVVGFFFIWRALSRLESRIDELSSRDCHTINSSCQMMSSALSGGYDTPLTDKTNERKAIPSYEKVNDKGSKEEEEEESDECNDCEDCEDYEEDYEEEDEDDIALMKACFGDIPLQTFLGDAVCPFTIFQSSVEQDYESDSDDSVSDKTKTKITLEEARDESEEDDEKQQTPTKPKAKTDTSTSETDAQEFSKTRLKKMNLDALREICSSRGLSVDGSKAILMDRIISSVPNSA